MRVSYNWFWFYLFKSNFVAWLIENQLPFGTQLKTALSWSDLFLYEFLFLKITPYCHSQELEKAKMEREIQKSLRNRKHVYE